jgi:phosphoesterase RecJ-like protein
MEAGANPWLITENVYESFAYRRLVLLGHVLADIQKSRDGRTAWVVVTDDLYQRTGTSAEDTDNFVNFVRSVKGVEVAVLFRQIGPDQYKISLRSKGRVDLSGVAQSMGGGGHKNAAGGVLGGTFPEVRERVIRAVQQQIDSQLGTTAMA